MPWNRLHDLQGRRGPGKQQRCCPSPLGVACTAVSLLNNGPGLLALIDNAEEQQPRKVLHRTARDASDILSVWKRDRVALSVEATDDLTLSEAGEAYDQFKALGLEHFLVGELFMKKKRENDLVVSASRMDSLSLEAKEAIKQLIAHAQEPQPQKVVLRGVDDAADIIKLLKREGNELLVDVTVFTLDEANKVFEMFRAEGWEKCLVGEKFTKKKEENDLLMTLKKMGSPSPDARKTIEAVLGLDQVQPSLHYT